MRRLVVVLAILCLLPSRASAGFFGWTKDGRWIVLFEQAESEDEEKHGEPEGLAIVVDVATGRERRFELAAVEEAEGPANRSEAFDRWLAEHPLLPLHGSRQSPDGRASAEISLREDPKDGAWRGGTSFQTTGRSEWSLDVRRGGIVVRSGTVAGSGSITPHWSPDGKRVLWVVGHGGRAPIDSGWEDLVLGPAVPEGVGLLVPTEIEEKGDAVTDSLSKASFVPIFQRARKRRARDRSVVYVKPGDDKLAQRLIGCLPGGANVAPLDPRSLLSAVVEVGRSATK
jgi:hypothetical protein